MKKILLNIAFMAILGSIGLAYTTDIDADDLNVNHFSKLPNELMYHICQNLSFKDNVTLGMVDKERHNITNAYIDLNFSKLKLFGNQSYIVEKLYSPDEFRNLRNLALDVRYQVNKIADKYKNSMDKPIKYFAIPDDEYEATTVYWTTDNRKNGSIRRLHLYKQNVLEFAQHENMLNTVSKLLGCPANQVHHKKNDIIYDRYKEFIVHDTHTARTAYSELGAYKLKFCKERDIVDRWQANSFNCCYINAMTLLSPYDITVDVWKDAMSIKLSTKSYKFRKTHEPNESIILKPGDTILWHPYTEIYFRPEDISLDEIYILSNGFAHPKVSKRVESATIPRLK